MQFKLWFMLALTGSSVADKLDGPAVTSSLASLDSALGKLDKSFKAITAANVATQVTDINAQVAELGKVMADTSGKLKTSKPLGLADALTLTTPITSLGTTLQSVLAGLTSKRDIIIGANQADKLGAGLKAIKGSLTAFVDGLASQLPAGILPAADIAGLQLAPGGEGKLIDLAIDLGFAIYKGTPSTIQVPGGILKGKGSKRAIEFAA